jgi:predicted acylesterase/phospholipase RssA
MQNSIIAQRIKANPPDILIRPDVENVEILEFDKAPSVYRQAAPAAEHLRRELERVLYPRRPPGPRWCWIRW